MEVRIGFMPGSGGNFLARCLNLHDHIDWLQECVGQDREHKWPYLCYDEVMGRVPGRKAAGESMPTGWRDWEHKHARVTGSQHKAALSLHHGTEHKENFDILISTETQDEWRWSIQQALWKDTVFHRVSYLITGLKTHNADVVVPCHQLWNFDLLTQPGSHRATPGSGEAQPGSQAVAETPLDTMEQHTRQCRHTEIDRSGHARTHQEIAQGQALWNLM